MTITDLEPKLVFGIFDEITKVPRPSKRRAKSANSFLNLLNDTTSKPRPTQSATWLCVCRQRRVKKALRQWCFRDTWIWCPTRPSRKHIISTPIRF